MAVPSVEGQRSSLAVFSDILMLQAILIIYVGFLLSMLKKIEKPKPLLFTLHHELVSTQGTVLIKYWLNLIDLVIDFCC